MATRARAPSWLCLLALVDASAAPNLGRDAATLSPLEQLVADHYPAHYVARKLDAKSGPIDIDGRLDEAAWAEVPWLDDFMDLAGPRFQDHGTRTWQEASRAYAEQITGSKNPTRVKVRWDEGFLYVGAELVSSRVAASVTGHCEDLTSSVWTQTSVLPYFDDDFEVFVDASQSNYFYVEYEVNARNATYSTLWSLPQAGLGSVAPECGGGAGPRRTCCNTTWHSGAGLCDHGPEREGAGWTLEMYEASQRPGRGMASAVSNNTHSWSVEIRFPILSRDEHGGLINLPPGGHLPGSRPEQLHPARGQRFWGATFANAMHARWWADIDANDTRRPDVIKSMCERVIAADIAENGFTQFLLDANNAAPTCYYEASSQNLGGHQYMHNPDNFGYLEFTGAEEPRACRNVQWLGRFLLAQVYQAQVQFLVGEHSGNGTYATDLAQLLSYPAVCNISNACNATALRAAADHVRISMAVQGGRTGPCARYAVSGWQTSNWTGGPCFNATVAYTVRSRSEASKVRQVVGAINEERLIRFDAEVGQKWDDPDSGWLCLDDVILGAPSIYI